MKPVNNWPVTVYLFFNLLKKYFLLLTLFLWEYVDVERKSGFSFPSSLLFIYFLTLLIDCLITKKKVWLASIGTDTKKNISSEYFVKKESYQPHSILTARNYSLTIIPRIMS